MAYLFGDSSDAAARLRLLARVFEPSTREFIRDALPRAPALALDLGCGPGLTTRLLAQATGCPRVVGLDSSEPFIEAARQRATAGLEFRRADATRSPLPVAGADLLFCRFLLTHFKDAQAIVMGWVHQLPRRGLLLIEEPERIDTVLPAFRRYLKILGPLMRSRSNDLFVGARLAGFEPGGEAAMRLNRLKRLTVADRDAAAMFRLNLETWKDDPFIAANYSAETIRELAAALEPIAQRVDERSQITWRLRQIAIEAA